MKTIRTYIRPISATLLLLFITELIRPAAVFAITGHDSMPEYRSFEPVSTTNMVNLFDGSFTYNLPLLDVPNGYPINLSYHSNEITNESMSSWVGLGWNINPGTINRMKRGFPDEFKGQEVTYHNKMPANWTLGVNLGIRPEIFGGEKTKNSGANTLFGKSPLNLGTTLRYNNYNGLSSTINGGLSFAGIANLDFSYTNGRFGFSPNINPYAILNGIRNGAKNNKNRSTEQRDLQEEIQQIDYTYEQSVIAGAKKQAAKNEAKAKKSANKAQIGMSMGGVGGGNIGTGFSSNFRTPQSYPLTVSRYTGYMIDLKFDQGFNWIPIPLRGEIYTGGSYAWQLNDSTASIKTYGYMHSESATADENAMMDYYTENDKMFEKRERIIGYPLPNNDVYNLSGEAMGGSFRAFRSEFGHYRKNKVRNEEFSANQGIDIGIPTIISTIPLITHTTTTVGTERGLAYHFSKVLDWNDMTESDQNYGFTDAGEKYFFRFSGDKAGYFDQSDNGTLQGTAADEAFQAEIDQGFLFNGTPKLTSWTGNQALPDRLYTGGTATKQKKRSTHILEHLNSEFDDVATISGTDYKYKVYEKNLHTLIGTTPTAYDHNATGYNADGIGEIVTTNTDGVTYVYGLPVYAKNEQQLSYGFPNGNGLTFPGSVLGEPVANVNSGFEDAKATRKVGYESDHPYATTHLITQILSPDYIDRKGDGPTPDDFGSFTRFNYQRIAGGSDWYGYRSPYKGVTFNMGSLSDKQDDMGNFSYGEKEIYYMHSIVSKTHVAIFTLEDRDDARSVELDNNPFPSELVVGSSTNEGKMALQRLKRIDLYALNDCQLVSGGTGSHGFYEPNTNANPIKTVHFEYDYSLCADIPNNNTVDGGKLTLKKVWFEYGGKVTSRISPYQFEYAYPTTNYPAPYDTKPVNDYVTTDYTENPDYNVANTDRWGYFRDFNTMKGNTSFGLDELAYFWPFVHQNPDTEDEMGSGDDVFDPAAYCLKQITLPSGGEIHIQYEQADYHYVQDQVANLMIPLKSDPTTPASEKNADLEDKKYYLDLAKVGISYGSGEEQELADQLFEPMFKNKDRMFFNFLYALIGDTPNYKLTSSDYIEGYARINGYGYDGSGIYFTFKGSSSNFTTISYDSKVSKRELPRKVCQEFFKNQRKMKIGGGPNAAKLEKEGNKDDPSAKRLAKAFTNLLNSLQRIDDAVGAKCAKMQPDMSYVRLQLPAGQFRESGTAYSKKLGGGVRVKRLLMYDQDNADNQAVLFGNEYDYTTEDNEGNTISSGVATNEPGIGRRENALVKVIDKDPQKKLQAMLYGRDMYSQEGPLGESLLPGPSIGYSKVTIQSIHQGKTGTGWEVNEFHTVKDHPFNADPTEIKQVYKYPLGLSFAVGPVSLSYNRESPILTQGYVFKSFSMHGKPARISKWTETDGEPIEVASEHYEYFEPGDQIKVIGDNLKEVTIPFEYLGKESEILAESREVQDYTFDLNISADATGGTVTVYTSVPPPTYPIAYNTIKVGGAVTEKIYRTHVTSKVITYPAMLKRSINVTDGVVQITENVAFDDHTGEPVVVASYDGFTGKHTNQDIMASWEYPGMKARFLNEDLVVPKPTGINGDITFGTTGGRKYLEFDGDGSEPCDLLAHFTRGDFIDIVIGSANSTYHVDEIDLADKRLYVLSSQFSEGDPVGTIDQIHIIKSGYTNQLSAKAANIIYFSKENAVEYYVRNGGLDLTNDFVDALNDQVSVFDGTTNPQTVTLAGPFSNMNVSYYSSDISQSCGVDVTNVQISDVEIEISYTSPTLTLTINSFKVFCNNQTIAIVDCCVDDEDGIECNNNSGTP